MGIYNEVQNIDENRKDQRFHLSKILSKENKQVLTLEENL